MTRTKLEDGLTPQQRYHEKIGMIKMTISISPKTEQDVIDRLNEVPNKAGYIKALIRADIEKNKTNN